MRDVQKSAKSGHLHFSHGGERRSLLVRRGAIAHGTSDVSGQHLGDILVRYGYLTQIDLERAMPMALRDRRRLGDLLVEMGLVARDRVHEVVAIQIREILSEVTSRSDGSFAFEELSDQGADAEAVTYPIGQMILETARRIQSPEIVGRALGDRSRKVSLSTHPLLRSQALALTPTEGFLLSRIDGTTTANEALGLVPLPIEDVERSLFALLCTGAIEYVSAGEATGARARPTRARAAPDQDASGGREKLREAARAAEQRAATVREAIEARQTGEARRREITAAHDGIAGKSHFEVLGVDPGCSTGEVETAFRRLAQIFHPDVPLDRSLADLRGKRVDVYARLLEAYEVLSNLDRRSEYKASLDARKGDAKAPGRPAASSLPPQVPQVVSLYAEGPLDPEVVFDKIREAHQLIREEKAWDAIQLLQSLITKAAGHNRFRAQVLLARAFLKNPKWTKRAEDLLRQVVREAPEHAEAYVVLGNIYRSGDLRTRALAMYRRALSLQPAHPEAVEGLEALEPTPADPGRGTLMWKIFGKGSSKEP
jgi:tetratricopeptide (TPR) repeat protein